MIGPSRQDDVHRQVGGSGDPRLHFNHSPSRAKAENRARSHSDGHTRFIIQHINQDNIHIFIRRMPVETY